MNPETAGDQGSTAVLEDRRRHKRTTAEDDAVTEFRRLLADMMGESPADSEQLEPEAEAVPARDSIEPTPFAFPEASETGITEATTIGITEATTSDESQLQDSSADPSPETPVSQETADAGQEQDINPTSFNEPDPDEQEIAPIDDERQTVPVPVDRDRVEIELKDGRRLDAWRRSSPSTGRQMLILDVIAAFDSHGEEIPSTPADSFIFRSEVNTINGSWIHQVQDSDAPILGNPTPDDEMLEQEERSE
jgi:cytochrome c556